MNERLNAAAKKFAKRYEISIDMDGYEDVFAALEDELAWRTCGELFDEEARRKWELVLTKWKLVKKSIEEKER